MTYYTHIESPIGPLLLTSDGTSVTRLYMNESYVDPSWSSAPCAVLEEAVRQLKAYFSGDRRDFDLPLDGAGTGFQKTVWRELALIPYGVTISYGELARRIGQPSASRAVGLANGRNPISIVVPCHRVIGANGTLTGYGGGLDNKRWLLEHESRVAGARQPELAL